MTFPERPSRATAPAVARLLAGAATVSFAPVFVRLTAVPPLTSAFYRTLLGALVLAALVKAGRGRIYAGRASLAPLAAAGLFFAFDLWAWHASIVRVGPGLATLLANFQVFFLAAAGIALHGERFRWSLAVAVPLALGGLALIVGIDPGSLGPAFAPGVGLGLLSAVFYAGYLLCLRHARARGTPVSPAGDLAVVSGVCAAALAALAPLSRSPLTVPTVRDAGLLAGYALVAQVLGWVLISGSLSRVPASSVGLILLLQPTLAFVWDVTFFHRPFGAREAAGAALTLIAIRMGSRAGPRFRGG